MGPQVGVPHAIFSQQQLSLNTSWAFDSFMLF